MLRYYAIASVIVLLAGAIVVARHVRARDLKIASVQVRVSPRPDTGGEDFSRSATGGFRLQGPAVLSTLPDCVLQTGYFRGTRAFVDAHVPARRVLLAAGSRRIAGACTLAVGSTDVVASRGSDRVRVPPRARLFAIAGGYLLDVDSGRTIEARSYRVVSRGAGR